MTSRFKVGYLALIIFPLLFSLKSLAQDADRPLVFPLASFSLDSDVTWLSKIFDNKIADGVQWVGLGEFTHGGEETVLFKSKMIQYLVTERGYRQVLVEYPDVILLPLSNYLRRTSSGSLDSVKPFAQAAFKWTVLANKPFYDLLIWLKQYNLEHPGDMVSLKGVDIEGASTAFADYFMYSYLLPLDPSGALELLSKWSDGPKDSIAVAELKWFDENKQRIAQYSGERSYAALLYDIKAARNELTHESLKKESMYKASSFRDSIMAGNILSLNASKAIIWAHNMHLTTDDYAISLGNYLNAVVGKKYFTILTEFSEEATILAISNNNNMLIKKTFGPNKKTIAAIINKKYNLSEGIVFFNSLKAGIQPAFNNIDRAGWQSTIPGKGHPFDALVIFSKVNPIVFD